MKKAIIFLIAISISIGIPARCFAKVEEDAVTAKSAILMCMDTGDIIYEKNAYEHLSPASVTKIMTILLVLEAIDTEKIKLTDEVTASEQAVAMGGSQIWLEVGEKMTVDELLKAIIIASANDACTALGEHIAGSVTGFVKMMNDRAIELGLKDTVFENSTGLDDDVKNHYSCAHDLAVIACEVMKYEIVEKYATVWLDSLRGGETELNNTNKLVNKYNGITGLKTGTTSNAGFCLCATAQRDEMNLVSVVLGSETSDERFDSTSYLLDYGFANYSVATPEIDKNAIKPVKVLGGVEKEITPAIKGADKILVKKGMSEFTYEYSTEESVKAPVKKGDCLGFIDVKFENKTIMKIDLVAKKEVVNVSFKDIFSIFIKMI